MLFSVVIPTHNRLEFLKVALDSVWKQTFTNFEIIVVDDGSTDGTAEFILSHQPQVRLVTQPNVGPGVGRNQGARHAKGRYLAFLDSDDLWFPWTLSSIAELIALHNDPSILSANVVEFRMEAELTTVAESPVKAEAFVDYFASHAYGYYAGAGMSVLRRDIFIQSGGYTDKPINAEDHDLLLRLGDASGFIQVTAPPTLAWRRHATSATQNFYRTAIGSMFLIKQEVRGTYPGGPERAGARRNIITRHTRPISIACLREGLLREAWSLYWATFLWHLRLGRWKYIAGFLVCATVSIFRWISPLFSRGIRRLGSSHS